MEKLEGGNLTSVYKSGNTVLRSQGPWSPTIHRLLNHLEAEGFKDCPRFLGINENNEEILSFVQGISDETYPQGLTVEQHLDGMKILGDKIRRFHDISATFQKDPDDFWMLSYDGGLEADVICHNDIAPYNMTFIDGYPAGMIDFDTVCPGPRIWDIVYALYRFVPFQVKNDDKKVDRFKAVEVFYEGYGMPVPANLFEVMIERLQALADYILIQAEAGDVNFKRMLDEGHRALYLNDIANIQKTYL